MDTLNQKVIFQIMWINNFRGDLTDNSAKKEALSSTSLMLKTQALDLLFLINLQFYKLNQFLTLAFTSVSASGILRVICDPSWCSLDAMDWLIMTTDFVFADVQCTHRSPPPKKRSTKVWTLFYFDFEKKTPITSPFIVCYRFAHCKGLCSASFFVDLSVITDFFCNSNKKIGYSNSKIKVGRLGNRQKSYCPHLRVSKLPEKKSIR